MSGQQFIPFNYILVLIYPIKSLNNPERKLKPTLFKYLITNKVPFRM